MASHKRLVIILLSGGIVIYSGLAIWNESFYWDRALFLSPVEYKGSLPIRNDWRGNGDFGTRRKGNRHHQGIDILADVKTPVRASKGGLAFASNHRKGLGRFVEIKHKNGLVTIYSHLSRIYINKRQMVRQGQIIGEVGKTGNARYRGIQPHLHFEVRKRGVAVDPKRYLYNELSKRTKS